VNRRVPLDYEHARRVLETARSAAEAPGSDRATAVDELLALDEAIAARLAALHERGQAITLAIRESPDDSTLEALADEITHRDIELAMLQELAADVATAAAAFRPPPEAGPVH
jgi:flagellar hook-length control protein FliK